MSVALLTVSAFMQVAAQIGARLLTIETLLLLLPLVLGQNSIMEDLTDILGLLSLDSQMRPPPGCKQIRSQTKDLARFIRDRIDHITAVMRSLGRNTMHLNTVTCKIFVGPKRKFDERKFMRLVQESKGQQQWICCGPRRGQLVQPELEKAPIQESSTMANPDSLAANEDVVHRNDSAPTQIDFVSGGSAAVPESFHLNEFRLRYYGFRTEMIEKVKQEMDTLKATIVTNMKNNGGAPPSRRTRQSQAIGAGNLEVSLDRFLSKSLGNFTVNFLQTLDQEFARRFPELSEIDEQLTAANSESIAPVAATEPTSQSAMRPDPDDPGTIEALATTTSLTPLPMEGSNISNTVDPASRSPSSPQVSHLDSNLRVPAQAKKRAAKVGAVNGRKRTKYMTSPSELAAQLVDQRSVRRFMALVRKSRRICMPLASAEFNITGSWDERAAGYWTLAHVLGDSSILYRLMSLLAQIQVAEGLDRAANELGYGRAPSDMIERVLKALGQSATRDSRSKFQEWLRKPRKLVKVFGSYIGLLPFISLEEEESSSVTIKDLLEMSERQAAIFRSCLEVSGVTEVLSRTGQRFQECMLSRNQFPDMVWERDGTQALDGLAVDELIHLMAA